MLERARRAFDFKMVVYEATFDDALTVVRGHTSNERNRVRVIASGGATLGLLQNDLVGFPCANIFPREYDLLLALEKAKKARMSMGLLVPGKIKVEVVRKLCALVRVQTNIYIYHNWEEILTQVKKAKQEGVQLLVGTGERIASAVEAQNLEYISVISSEETLMKALKRAQYIIDAQQKESIFTEQLKAIGDFSSQGVIGLNEKKVITIFNSQAVKFFGLREQEVVGHSLQELISNPSLVGLFQEADKKLNFIYEAPRGNILVNRVPIFDKQQFCSLMLTFQEVTKEESKKGAGAKGLVAKYHFSDIIHHNSKMTEVINKALKYANTDCSVLIKGETGTGKELLAQSIHNGHRKRCKKPFVAINCASLDGNLLESELFGYSEGSFTGASKGGKPGLFELAHEGTLFLDEIGKMKWETQAKLLRVLQEKEVRRIGSDRIIPVDIRIIAASNEDLQELVRKGEFREDLYYRLNVLRLNIPPLRERREDIPYLVEALLKKHLQKYGKPDFQLAPSTIEELSKRNWYGNVRQLEHFLERCVVLTEDSSDLNEILLDMLAEEEVSFVSDPKENSDTINIRIGSLEDMNMEIVQKIKERENLSNSQLALKLGISRPTLLKLLNRATG